MKSFKNCHVHLAFSNNIKLKQLYYIPSVMQNPLHEIGAEVVIVHKNLRLPNYYIEVSVLKKKLHIINLQQQY